MHSRREILTLLSKDEFLLTMLAEQIGEHGIRLDREDDDETTWEEIGRDAVAGMLEWPLDDGLEGPADLERLTLNISVDDDIKIYLERLTENVQENIEELHRSFRQMTLLDRLKFLFLGERCFI